MPSVISLKGGTPLPAGAGTEGRIPAGTGPDVARVEGVTTAGIGTDGEVAGGDERIGMAARVGGDGAGAGAPGGTTCRLCTRPSLALRRSCALVKVRKVKRMVSA